MLFSDEDQADCLSEESVLKTILLLSRQWNLNFIEKEADNSSKSTVLNLKTCQNKISVLDQLWSSLSEGESQRLMLAFCLATLPTRNVRGPLILLLDEVTSALDLQTKIVVEDTIRQWLTQDMESNNRCVIWATHDEEQKKRIREVQGRCKFVENAEEY